MKQDTVVTRFPRCGDRLIARVFLLALFACSDNPDDVTGPNFSLESPEIVVTTIDPDTVTVDTMVTVRITGSGFPDSSTATWLIDTTTAPGITTLSTTWKSSTEIEAVILVSPDAALRLYSVRIRGKKGKQGIAVEKFRIVAKPTTLPEPFGTRSEATDINDSGVIVGSAWNASGVPMAVRWTPNDTGWSYTVLGRGATSINNAGLIPRSTLDNVARAWHTWIHLPSGAEVDFGPVSVRDISDNGTMIGAIYDNALRGTPVVWRQVSQTRWGAPETLPIPAGFTTAWYERINGVGDVVGVVMNPDSSLGVIWKFRNGEWLTPEPVDRQLPGGAIAINDAGAMAGWVVPCIQGLPNCYAIPAFWPSAGGARRMLPTLYNTQGSVRAINNANQVVGWALVHVIEGSLPRAALIRHAVIWFPGSPWPEDLGTIRLSEVGEAVAINNHGWVVGKMQKSFFDYHATVWKLPSTPNVVAPLATSRR